MKHIKTMNESLSSSISTEKLYVVKTNNDTDIYIVYKSKSEAQTECDKKIDDIYNYYKKLHKNMPEQDFAEYLKHYLPKYRVLNLQDAIDEIKDYIRDEYHSHGNPGY